MSCPRFIVTAHTNMALLPPSRGLTHPYPLPSIPSAAFRFSMAYCCCCCVIITIIIVIIIRAEMDISGSYVLKETRRGQEGMKGIKKANWRKINFQNKWP